MTAVVVKLGKWKVPKAYKITKAIDRKRAREWGAVRSKHEHKAIAACLVVFLAQRKCNTSKEKNYQMNIKTIKLFT